MFQFTQRVQLMADPGERIEDLLPANVSNARVAEVLFNIARPFWHAASVQRFLA